MKINAKWNPNLTFAKIDLKMIIFHIFGSVPEGKNAFLLHFSKIPSQGVMVTIFHNIFHSLLFVSLPNTQK